MLLDVKTSHPEIHIQAKELNCEEELDEIKNNIIEYLLSIRNKISS